MGELVKAINQFIYRDLVYVFGGGLVLLSAFYASTRFSFHELKDIPTPIYILAAGFAYVLGYMLQDLFSVLQVVTTTYRFEPWPILKCIYERFEHQPWPWESVPQFDPAAAFRKISNAGSEHERKEVERIISLMVVGTTMGPCCLISVVPLLIRLCRDRTSWFFDASLVATLLVASVTLIGLGWLKAAQLMRHVYELYDELRKRGT